MNARMSQLALRTLVVSMLFVSSIMSDSAYHLKSQIEAPNKIWWFTSQSKIYAALPLGYNNLIATLLWMDTLTYIGNPNRKNRNYKYLASRLESITNIYPTMISPYYVAAVILPWDTSSTKESNKLLDKAMLSMPNDWTWPYYRGFNAYWFDHDLDTASLYLKKSANIEGSPPIVTTLALRMHAEASQLDTAIIFLNRLIKERGQDSAIQKQLIEQLHAIETEKQLRQIDKWLSLLDKRFYDQRDLNTLRNSGFHIPKQLPDGGEITFSAEGDIVSSIARKRYKVFVPPKRQRILNE